MSTAITERKLTDFNPYWGMDIMNFWKTGAETLTNFLTGMTYESAIKPNAETSRFAANATSRTFQLAADLTSNAVDYWKTILDIWNVPGYARIPFDQAGITATCTADCLADEALTLEKTVDQTWQLPEKASTFIHLATRQPEQVHLTLPNEVAYEHELVDLVRLDLEDGNNEKNKPLLFLTPWQRDATLVDYDSHAKPRKSIARGAMHAGFGPIYVTQYKNAHPKINDKNWLDYAGASAELADFVLEEHGVKAPIVSICANVYLTSLMLGMNPDATDVHTAIAGPWDMHAGNPFIVDMVSKYSQEYNDSVIRANGGHGRADMINSMWLTARDEDRYDEYIGRYVNLFAEVFKDGFDPHRVTYFRDWLFTTGIHVPGAFMSDIFRFFKDNLTGKNKLGVDISEYKGALCVAAADPKKDWISPEAAVLSLLYSVGTPAERSMQIKLPEVGHHGSYSSGKVIEPVYEAKVFPWMHEMQAAAKKIRIYVP